MLVLKRMGVLPGRFHAVCPPSVRPFPPHLGHVPAPPAPGTVEEDPGTCYLQSCYITLKSCTASVGNSLNMKHRWRWTKCVLASVDGPDVPVMLVVEPWRLAMLTLSLLCSVSWPTSTTSVCIRGQHHFTVYFGPTGTRVLTSGEPLMDKHVRNIFC